MRILVTVKGLDLTLKALKETQIRVPKITGATNLRLAKTIVDYARENVRNRVKFKPNTGRLENSIRIIRRGRNNKYITVGATAPYASEVEFGTSDRIRTSYLRIPIHLRMGWAGNTEIPYIHHPGSKPMYFMTNALERLNTQMENIGSHSDDINMILVDIWKKSYSIGNRLPGSVHFRR